MEALLYKQGLTVEDVSKELTSLVSRKLGMAEEKYQRLVFQIKVVTINIVT